MKRRMQYAYILVSVLLVASCSTTRKAGTMPMVGGLTGMAYMEKVIELSPAWTCVGGKVALGLDMGGKGNAKLNATLRLKRGETIRLTVAPLLGIEVARLEITPQGLLFLDRLNKRYVEVPFDEISRLAHTELNFNILQSLFLNELFLPGKATLDVTDAGKFRIDVNGGQALLDVRESGMLSYRFITSADQGLLQESRIGIDNTPYQLRWTYSDFNQLDGRMFPSHMLLSVDGTGSPLSLDMQFSRLSVNEDWDARTEIPARYKKVELTELVNSLLKK